MKFHDVRVKTPRGIEAIVSIDHESILIYPEKDSEVLTPTELGQLTAFAFLYVVTSQKGMVMDFQYLLDKAQMFYFSLLKGDYHGLRSIGQMSVEEFNDEMKGYNGREQT